MTDGDILLKAILANPDDDLPRLQYADWCEETEQPERGEFVRVQIESVKHPCRYEKSHRATHCVHRFCKNCRQYRDREHDLLEGGAVGMLANWCRWSQPINAMPPDLTFRRGFVEEITCPWEAWSRHADEITSRHPIRKVALATLPDSLDALPGEDLVEVAITYGHASAFRYALQNRWPRITFELPPLMHTPQDPRQTVDLRRWIP